MTRRSLDRPNKEQRFIAIICLIGGIVFLFMGVDTLLQDTSDAIIPNWAFAIICFFYFASFLFIGSAIWNEARNKMIRKKLKIEELW